MDVWLRMLTALPPGLEIRLDDALEGQFAARPSAGDGRRSSSSSANEFGLVFVKVNVSGPGEDDVRSTRESPREARQRGERTGSTGK
jgi:hypothetical protein